MLPDNPTLSYSFRIPAKLRKAPRKMSAFTTSSQRQFAERGKQQRRNTSGTTVQKERRRQRTMTARSTWTGVGHGNRDEGSTATRLLGELPILFFLIY
uniref:Uncharacterized protein n=1 Tax=Globodera pallida TaxID=36090 RepID=A0A183C3H5_GLOPA